MWLLNTGTLQLHEFQGDKKPNYAILSHTWAEDEITFQDMQVPASSSLTNKPGFRKIEMFCKTASALGYVYGWADVACIDKKSSAELSEAINSMYRWYSEAGICLIYLADMQDSVQVEARGNDGSLKLQTSMKQSRWFKRGWTLQELLACNHRRFYNSHWEELSFESSGFNPISICYEVTGINLSVLRGWSAKGVQNAGDCLATRMSWAANRETSRPEDVAYSLMGIFAVNIPILYGEGGEAAFRRLQIAIMQTSSDQTLFAWRGRFARNGLLARSPQDFADTPQLIPPWSLRAISPFSLTNVGTLIRLGLLFSRQDDRILAALQCLVEIKDKRYRPLILLERIRTLSCCVNGSWRATFRRVECQTWKFVEYDSLRPEKVHYEDVVVLEIEEADRHSVDDRTPSAVGVVPSNTMLDPKLLIRPPTSLVSTIIDKLRGRLSPRNRSGGAKNQMSLPLQPAPAAPLSNYPPPLSSEQYEPPFQPPPPPPLPRLPPPPQASGQNPISGELYPWITGVGFINRSSHQYQIQQPECDQEDGHSHGYPQDRLAL